MREAIGLPVEYFMTDDGLKPFVKHDGNWIRLSDTETKIERIRVGEIVSHPHSLSQNLSHNTADHRS